MSQGIPMRGRRYHPIVQVPYEDSSFGRELAVNPGELIAIIDTEPEALADAYGVGPRSLELLTMLANGLRPYVAPPPGTK